MSSNNVRLLAHSPDLLRALREDPAAYESQAGVEIAEGIRELLSGPEVSESFLARLRDATAADPWRDGFGVIHVVHNRLIDWPASMVHRMPKIRSRFRMVSRLPMRIEDMPRKRRAW